MNKSIYKQILNEVKSNFDYDVEDAKIEFAIQLASFLEKKSISKKELASRLGVSAPMVTKILRGDTNLTIETMVRAVRTAGGKLHMKLVDEGSDGKWFELIKNHQFVNKHEKSIKSYEPLMSWKVSANDHENESIAA